MGNQPTPTLIQCNFVPTCNWYHSCQIDQIKTTSLRRKMHPIFSKEVGQTETNTRLIYHTPPHATAWPYSCTLRCPQFWACHVRLSRGSKSNQATAVSGRIQEICPGSSTIMLVSSAAEGFGRWFSTRWILSRICSPNCLHCMPCMPNQSYDGRWGRPTQWPKLQLAALLCTQKWCCNQLFRPCVASILRKKQKPRTKEQNSQ